VEISNNGKEAIEKVKEMNFDLIFMDLQMPEIDGYTATQKIKELKGEKSKIPIIALTAYTAEEEKEKCLKFKMSDYLSKPITKEKLEMIINKWIK